MQFIVPQTSHPYSPPRFDGDHIPAEERDAVEHLLGITHLLGWYEHQFRLALALFDQCQTPVSLGTFTSRTILPASSTMQTLVSLTDTSSPAKWSMLRFSF